MFLYVVTYKCGHFLNLDRCVFVSVKMEKRGGVYEMKK